MKHLILTFAILMLSVLAISSELSLAVLDFEPRGINADQAVIITDILRTELLKTGRITIVEREKINAIMREHQFSEVGITESVELGKLLGVDKIIFGRIGTLGDSYIITVRMIDIRTAKVDFADQYTCQATIESITKVMKDIASRVVKYLPPLEGKIALRKEDTVFITLSSKDGIKEGMELPVFRVEKIVDEEGNVVFEKEKQIGKIKVEEIGLKGSMAKVVEEKEKIKKGDIVKVVVGVKEAKEGKGATVEQRQDLFAFKKPLPYWIEHDESGRPINYLWVKVPKIPAGGSKVLYIRKEPGYSPNGDAVFEFFDDFDGTSLVGWKVDDGLYDDDGSVDYFLHDSVIEINRNGEAGHLYRELGFEITTNTQYAIEYRGKTGRRDGKGECTLELGDGKPSEASRGYFIHPYNAGDEPNEWSFRVGYMYNETYYKTTNVLHNLPYNTWCNFKLVINRRNLRIYEHCDNGLTQENSITVSSYHYPYASKIFIRGCCQDRPRHAIYDYIFIRKYADSEPTVAVLNKGTHYEVIITNPNSYDLTDFQVAIPLSTLNITSATESLKIVEGGS